MRYQCFGRLEQAQSSWKTIAIIEEEDEVEEEMYHSWKTWAGMQLMEDTHGILKPQSLRLWDLCTQKIIHVPGRVS